MNKYFVFAGIGFELIGLIVASVFAGEAIEARWPSKGLWVAGLIVAALLGWMIHLVYLLKSIQKGNQKAPEKVQ